jgi:predicted N-acetyltransferase YhbS
MAYKALSMDLEIHGDRLLSLWKDNMSDQRIAEVAERRLPWFYGENPAGRPTTSVLVDDAANQIVGSGSFYPRKLVIQGKSLWMGVLADFMVDSAHRAAGAAVAIQRSLVESSRRSGMDLLAAYPNRTAEAIFKRVGYKPVGKSERWVKLLRSHKHIAKRVPYPIVAPVAAAAVDVGLSAWDHKHIWELSPSTRRLRGVYLDACDARFDRLWESAKNEYTITGERTTAYLHWRYRDFPSLRYRFFALTDPETERVTAYLTFFINAENSAIIGDLFTAEPGPTLDALLLRFSIAERKAGRSTICLGYLGSPVLGERLKNIGFHHRPTNRSLFVYFPPETPEAMQRVLSNPSNWFTVDAEMDI